MVKTGFTIENSNKVSIFFCNSSIVKCKINSYFYWDTGRLSNIVSTSMNGIYLFFSFLYFHFN